MRIDDFFAADFTALDHDGLHDAFDWVRAMADTPQDPRYHAEGDVWTHTRMVCDALTRDEDWAGLDAADRRLLLTAALLHDAGKPEVTFTAADGRIRSPEHAARGESLARRILWQEEQPFAFREAVTALVRHHMQPRYLMEQQDPRRRTFAISHVARCDRLAMLARADTRGRVTPDYDVALDAIAAFVDFCAAHGCLTGPRPFASDHARFLYFNGRLADADADPPRPAGPVLTVMSGLPGSGKDSWLARHHDGRPIISLDGIRAELGISPTGKQEAVVRIARERAHQLLSAGRDFVWNATTLSRRHRATLLGLAAPFDPEVRIVYIEAPPSLLFPRNSGRAAHAVVPADVIWRMTHIWQPPDCTEAHDVAYLVHSPHDARETARRAS